jgi:hypothetical protein
MKKIVDLMRKLSCKLVILIWSPRERIEDGETSTSKREKRDVCNSLNGVRKQELRNVLKDPVKSGPYIFSTADVYSVV